MLANSLVAAYACTITLITVLWLANRITDRQYSGAMAISDALAAVGCAIAGWTSVLYLASACAAWHAWSWWNGGGGDDTKRRLKRWAGRFQGVRRTAPAST